MSERRTVPFSQLSEEARSRIDAKRVIHTASGEIITDWIELDYSEECKIEHVIIVNDQTGQPIRDGVRFVSIPTTQDTQNEEDGPFPDFARAGTPPAAKDPKP